ncbi:MAG: hypothetical protein U1C74_29585 [Phenylobacterium sp.]|uniref:hypothetical protein n=1 Tax=Brevundimonas sp. TaxID=1871086 RepID=UPI002738005D|nr:hypothetical protein [Brevundimonas sp.]MDP3801151.1 hypothetical protein [Brevundimonas sp.]MDZ4375552.1 hypothetical protein [Phenylobacterium sp.]
MAVEMLQELLEGRYQDAMQRACVDRSGAPSVNHRAHLHLLRTKAPMHVKPAPRGGMQPVHAPSLTGEGPAQVQEFRRQAGAQGERQRIVGFVRQRRRSS